MTDGPNKIIFSKTFKYFSLGKKLDLQHKLMLIISQKNQGGLNFAEAQRHPGGWTYIRRIHLQTVVDSRNSGFTLVNVRVVADPVAQHGQFCISHIFLFNAWSYNRQASDRERSPSTFRAFSMWKDSIFPFSSWETWAVS